MKELGLILGICADAIIIGVGIIFIIVLIGSMKDNRVVR
jgi:hypothetical protein